jgi:hypothetical protein
MAKGQVTDKELATGLKTFGGFGALSEAGSRPRREDPFRDTRAEVPPAAPRIEVVKPPRADTPPPTAPVAPVAVEKSPQVRDPKPEPRRARSVRKEEPSPPLVTNGHEKKSELYTERVTVPLDAELRDGAEALAKSLQRRRTDKGERITANTVMRVALRVVLDSFDTQSVGVVNTEEELFQAVCAGLRPTKSGTRSSG